MGIRGWVAVLVLGLAACGGPTTHMPPKVEEAVKAADEAAASGNEPALCAGVRTLMPLMFEWQEHARGTILQVVVVQTQQLEGLTLSCQMQGTAPIRAQWEKWSKETHHLTEVKSSWGTIVKWLLLPLIAALIFWGVRRFLPG